jgi:hypothetical protein
LFGGVGKFVVTVGELNAAVIELEALGDFVATSGSSRFCQRRLRRRIVVEKLWVAAAEQRLNAFGENQVEPLVAVGSIEASGSSFDRRKFIECG